MLIRRTTKVFFPKFSRQFFAYNDKKYLVSREEMSLKKLISGSSFGFKFRTLSIKKDSNLVYGFIFTL